jgi:protein CrcB
MMFYLLVGVGGALGSIARAWMAIAVGRVTGPAFPWGTILINILGSFVIGFFGTLTAGEGRFGVPADARAFVMVGLCGGFTTFSSFSLQTLDLARDGRFAQAMGNVLLSVALCLTAVAAGHYGAASLQDRRPGADQAAAPTQGQVVVAVLNRPEHADGLLDAGARLLKLTGSGRIKALAVRMPAAEALLPSEEILTEDRAAAIRSEQENWAGQLHARFAAWAETPVGRGTPADWIDVEGDAVAMVTDHGRRSDAIVIARPERHETERLHDCLNAALFATDGPVLVVPPDGVLRPFGQTVAIAWKDDARAGNAVRSSLPLLRQAGSVHVLTADGPADVPPVLRDHGIKTVAHQVPEGDGSVGERLLRAAHEVGADLLVMGAFTHGEWRERLFGGVTRTMLAEADLPLWMQR